MKTFLYQAPSTDWGDIRSELGSFNISRNAIILINFKVKIVKKDINRRKQAKSKLTLLLIVKSKRSQ